MLALSIVNKFSLMTLISTVTYRNATIVTRVTSINSLIEPPSLSFTISHNTLSLVTPSLHYFKSTDFISAIYNLVCGVIYHEPDNLESEKLTNSNALVVVLNKKVYTHLVKKLKNKQNTIILKSSDSETIYPVFVQSLSTLIIVLMTSLW